ncbi:MAG: DNA-3-methyladenine glycosylase [Chloroherpetonaceae bacterium]|nr:DNA-3-methyladenine glycosylase [Chloroherpetonaceae bacterium]
MKWQKLPPTFYAAPTLEVAQALLGKYLVRRVGKTFMVGKIVETEGYIAAIDAACHAYRGMTERNRVMFGAAGHAYVYFAYGNHFMLNVVTEPEGEAAAVLIQALEPIEGIDAMKTFRPVEKLTDLLSGPGKLTQAMNITRSLNGMSFQSDELFVAEGEAVEPHQIGISTRIGISQAQDLPWRYFIKGNPFVSKGKPSASVPSLNAKVKH